LSAKLQYDEKELLFRIASGDDQAFDLVFRLYWDHVFSVALLMTKSPDMADDIGQEVFFALLKDRTRLAGIENLKGFLYTSVKFLVHKRLRRLKVEEAYAQYNSGKFHYQSPFDTVDQAVDLKELQASLQKGIDKLPAQQRRAFQLSRELGLSHEQISIEMGVSKKTVKDYIVRAIAFLRAFLQQHGDVVAYFALAFLPF
jgi:RNA polymerase sigma-70 factor (family 1)